MTRVKAGPAPQPPREVVLAQEPPPRAAEPEKLRHPELPPTPIAPRAPSARSLPLLAAQQWRIEEGLVAKLRAAAFDSLTAGKPSHAARAWTDAVDGVIAALDAEVTREMGPPPRSEATGKPVAYTVFAAGSYARRELSPYSDIDFGVLVSEATPEVRAYFVEYSKRIGARLKAIDQEAGLHACDVISPAGAIGDGLVDTPGGMARRTIGATTDMAARPLRDQDYLRTALSSTRAVLSRFGGAPLFADLERHQRAELGPGHPELDLRGRRWELIEILKRSLRDPFGVPDQVPGWGVAPKFVPLAPETAIADGKINVKHDLMKALQIPLFILRALYDLPELGGAEVLDALTRRGLIEPAFAHKLEETHEACLRLRFANHLALGKSEDKLAGVSDKDKRAIRRMVPLLFRLKQALAKLDAGNANTFALR